jgi:uncharacterized protein (DUF342 family)
MTIVTIDVNDDFTQAAIREMMPGISIDDVRAALAAKNIIDGIKWAEIERLIVQISSNQIPLFDVIVAEVNKPEIVMLFGERWVSPADTERIRKELTDLYTVVVEESGRESGASGMFVRNGETICSIQLKGETVLGKTSSVLENVFKFDYGPEIGRRLIPGAIEYEALKDGYVFFDTQNRMTIFDPVQVNETATRMHWYLLPVAHGIEELIERLYQAIHDVDMKNNVRNDELTARDEVADMMKRDRFEKRLIRKGIDPQQGKNGEVVLLVSKIIDKIDLTDAMVDYKEISPFQEIKQGVEIARRIHAVEGVAGKDIYGSIIAVPKVIEAKFKIGDHISERVEEDCTVFFAEIDGVLTLRDDYAHIDDIFKVAGDVSVQTGNVRYSKDVLVQGNICTGYIVECGGSLLVKGGIEDGATVSCKGNLAVGKGIFGQRGMVTVGGNGRIGFIQNSRIRVEGDLEVRDYIYQSDVFCRGALRVHGKQAIEKDKGCVIGGKVNSMLSMHLHSVGSEYARTELTCGVDMLAHDKLRQLELVVPLLNQKINRLRNSIEFDINDRTILETIKKLPEARRAVMKKTLSELKESLAMSEEARKKIEILTERVYSKDDATAVIEIKKGIIPPVYIRIRNQRFQIAKPNNQLKASLRNGELACELK